MLRVARRKSDEIADDLLSRIVSGEMPPGSLLPTEDELARSYGVTRTAVREAVKRLEVHRLVRPVRRRGTVALDPLESLSPEVIRAMLVPRRGRVDPGVFRGFLEVRALLDVEMAGLAALRRRKPDLARIEAAHARMEALVHAPREYARAVDDLARAIAAATGNPIFRTLVEWHRHVLEGLEDLVMLVRMPTAAYRAGSRALVEAIRARDRVRARAIVARFHELASARLIAAAEEMNVEEDGA